MASSRSTAASALGRWAMTITMPPRAAHAGDRLGQRVFALGVEVGVGLVEHDQERIAVERPGERHALALAGRQRRAALADLGLVAVRQLQDHVVHAGGAGGGDDLLGSGPHREAGDVLRHRAGEQLDVLRQVADVAAERLRRPLVERRAVEPDLAAHRLPDADQGAGERGLARGARADDAEAAAGDELEGDVVDDELLDAGRGDADALHGEARLGLRQRHRLGHDRQLGEEVVEPRPALPRLDEALPVADGELDRCERARGQDGAGDDDAGGRLLAR